MKLNVIVGGKVIAVEHVDKVTPRCTMHGKNPRFGILDVYRVNESGKELMIGSFSEVSSWWVEK